MEIISRISKGSIMDQVYLPKNRIGFEAGSYVVLRQIQERKESSAPLFFYNVGFLEPIKIMMINEIISTISSVVENYENIIITGSFLEKGFNFNDIDVLLINDSKIDNRYLENSVDSKTGVKIHLISINSRELIMGLSTDPLYISMLSKCVSVKRFVYRAKQKINYELLDLHLLKSKIMKENFDFLTGKEKYELIRNAISIALFLERKKISKSEVDRHIEKLFGKDMETKIRENMIERKGDFLDRYQKFLKDLSLKILEGVKNGSKQK